jgi:hypothetical protein
MGDIIVCFFGSVLVSVSGYISLKSKKNWLNKLMIRRFNDLEYAKEEAISSNDPYYIELINKIEKNKSKITK